MQNKVRESRKARGMTQGDLASALDVSRQTINAIETERYTPSLPLAMQIARFFEMNVEAIFDGSSDDSNA